MRHGEARRAGFRTGAAQAARARSSRKAGSGPHRSSRGCGKKRGSYPNLDKLDAALKPDWHGVRAAGRVDRHLEILRSVAHEINSDPERPDRPKDAAEAKERLDRLLGRLREEAPRTGLGAATGDFVDHVAGVASRYGRFIFTCFDHPHVPSTSNDLERYFGASKAQLRRALGAASTANGVAKNLGADYLEAFASAWIYPGEELFKQLEPYTAEDYQCARDAVYNAEQPATLRRSRRRNPRQHLQGLLARWGASP